MRLDACATTQHNARMNLASADSIWTIVLLAAATLLALILSFRFSRRVGGTVGEFCRACGYDVAKRPTDSTRCSECGADLAQPHAIVHGDSRRNWGVLIAGLAASVILLGFTFEAGRSLNWQRWFVVTAPDWYIIRQAKHSDSPGRFLSEWCRRDVRKTELIDQLIVNPRTNTALINKTIGSFSEAQLKRFLELCAKESSVSLTPRAREQETINLGVYAVPGVNGMQLEPIEIRVNDRPAATLTPDQRHAQYITQSPAVGLLGESVQRPGRYHVEFSFAISCRSITSLRIHRECDLEILPRDFAEGERVDFTPLQAQRTAEWLTPTLSPNGKTLQLIVFAHPDEVSFVMAFRVEVDTRSGRRILGYLNRENSTGTCQLLPVDLRDDGTIAVTFQGDARALDVNDKDQRYWPGRIVFDPVGVTMGGWAATIDESPHHIEMPTSKPSE